MRSVKTYHEFDNIGYQSTGRSFPGFPANSHCIRARLAPRDALRIEMGVEDLLSLNSALGEQSVVVLVFSQDGRQARDLLGLITNAPIDLSAFDSEPLTNWIRAQGGDAHEVLKAARVDLNELVVLKARTACTVWLVQPLDRASLVEFPSIGTVEVAHQPAPKTHSAILPPPLGRVKEEFTVKRGTALAYELRAGESVQIIDVEGQQCSDFMALRTRPLEKGSERGIDGTATRTMVRGTYPGPGLLDKFYDSDLRPILRTVQDTCGRHDMFGMACSARGYEDRGFPGHVNCSDNITEAYAPFGVAARAAWPAVNFFWNTWVDPHSQRILTEESHSRPGDYVVSQAIEDLVCVSTACPDDIDPINGWSPTDVHVRIYRPDTSIQRAVAYREKEDAPMSISNESPFHPATSKLTQHYSPARDLWLPVSYPHRDPSTVCRTA